MPCDNESICCEQKPIQAPAGLGECSGGSGTGIAGPRGAQGTTGADGADGDDGDRTVAFVGTGGFTMPAENAAQTIPIDQTIEHSGLYWIVPGLIIFIEDAGYFIVNIVDSTSIGATNLGYSVNTTAGTAIPEGAIISPAAPRGSDALPLSTFYAQLQQRETIGTAGGTFTSGAYRPRLLNSEVSDVGGLVLNLDGATGIFTLKGGYIYEFVARAAAFDVGGHKARIRNVDTSEIFLGTSEYSASAGGQTESAVFARAQVAVDTDFILEHRCQTTQATNGMGRPCSFADDSQNYELYASVEIWAVPS